MNQGSTKSGSRKSSGKSTKSGRHSGKSKVTPADNPWNWSSATRHKVVAHAITRYAFSSMGTAQTRDLLDFVRKIVPGEPVTAEEFFRVFREMGGRFRLGIGTDEIPSQKGIALVPEEMEERVNKLWKANEDRPPRQNIFIDRIEGDVKVE